MHYFTLFKYAASYLFAIYKTCVKSFNSIYSFMFHTVLRHFLFHISFRVSDVVCDIIRNCEFSTRPRDDVIIKQGERGDQ